MPILTPATAQFNTVQTPPAAQMDPALIGAPAQITAPVTGAAAQTQATLIDPNSLTTPTAVTSEDRIAGILNKGGPLMQQAATAGTQREEQKTEGCLFLGGTRGIRCRFFHSRLRRYSDIAGRVMSASHSIFYKGECHA